MNMTKEYAREIRQLKSRKAEILRDQDRIERAMQKALKAVIRDADKQLRATKRPFAKIEKRLRILEGRIN